MAATSEASTKVSYNYRLPMGSWKPINHDRMWNDLSQGMTLPGRLQRVFFNVVHGRVGTFDVSR